MKQLQRTGANNRKGAMNTSDKVEQIQFMLQTSNGRTTVSVVNHKLQQVEVDFRDYTGAEANLIRSINAIKSTENLAFSWGVKPDSGVDISLHPELLYMLSLCPRVVIADGTPVDFASDTAKLRFRMTNRADSGEIECHFECMDVSGAIHESIGFLTDNFIISGSTIYPITSIDGDVATTEIFETTISADMVDMFLSVLLSTINDVEPVYGSRKVRRINSEEQAVPTLIIEKVDSDNILFLRVTCSIGNLPPDLTDRFRLNRVVTVTDDEISIRNFKESDVTSEMSAVMAELLKVAPNRTAAKGIFTEDNLLVIPAEVAGPFLMKSLPAMLNHFRLLGVEKLKDYKIQPVKPKLNLKLGSGIDFLDGEASVDVGAERFTIQELLAQYRRNNYVQLSDGTKAVIDEAYMKRLERIFHKPKGKDGKVSVSFFDLPEIQELVNNVEKSEAFKRHRSFYEGFNTLADKELKLPKFKGKLRPYQTEGVKWIEYLQKNNLNGCLADDMGLGKTIQAIAVLSRAAKKAENPSLVVMPRSLLFNWQKELERFAPHLKVATYYGTGRNLDEALKANVILTTYALVRNDVEELSKQEFEYVILDESQNIKNLSAQLTRAVFLLKASHRLALSGTPIENNLTELFSLFHFLNPAMFGTVDQFNSDYAGPIQRYGDKDAMESLRRKIFPFVLRRLKRDVLDDLPERTDQTLFVEMEPDHAAYYERRRLYFRDEVNRSIAEGGIQKGQFVMFQALSELRRISSVPESMTDNRIKSPKLEMLVDQVAEAVGNGHKTVVFFNFIAGIELAGEMLSARGIDFVTMTGATHNREKVVNRFQTNPDCCVMLMTIKVGGVGLNLTAADTVFIFEPWWNKAAEEQAINRLHRIGQKNHVHSYSLITRGTIEEKILQLQNQKAELFDGIISADGNLSKQLSEEDINFILG